MDRILLQVVLRPCPLCRQSVHKSMQLLPSLSIASERRLLYFTVDVDHTEDSQRIENVHTCTDYHSCILR